MDQTEADRALAIIRQVVDHTRDDLVAQNWGLLWIIHAFTNFTAFLVNGFWVEPGGFPARFYLLPLGVSAFVNVVAILLLLPRDRGARSFVEAQMNGIWLSFIGVTALAALAIDTAGLPPSAFFFVITSGSATGFAAMGVVFQRRYFAATAAFCIVLLLGGPLAAQRWTALGAVWWSVLFGVGLSMHRARAARRQSPEIARIL
ncbi:MAG: hypothetical protein QM778_16430 [Myxococcales bacterium]